jgi:undecaprenyl diphosphate synthase
MTCPSSANASVERNAVSALPRHIAIVMDGNGRWATQRKLPRIKGHVRGVEAGRRIIEACARRGIEYLTVFAFSSENWRRPAEEVSFLMHLFVQMLSREVNKLHANNIRLHVIGDLMMFEPRIRDLIEHVQTKTANNTRMTLTVAANYGGRWDIVQAAQAIAMRAITEGESILPKINEAYFAQYLAMPHAPEPDLLIRTGGEQRISNFLLWQLAYTELYFTDKLWPDFDGEALDVAIHAYGQRERRFGQINRLLQTNDSL